MQSLPPDRAARDMSGAVEYLAAHSAVTSKGIGVVGFCMGGMLAFIIAANRPDKVRAVVPFYGFPQGPMEPDWSKLTASISGHMAENDNFFAPAAARALEAKLKGMGKSCTLTVHRARATRSASTTRWDGTQTLAAEICRGRRFLKRVGLAQGLWLRNCLSLKP
jgi:dienelactone hydrolase